MAIEAAVVGVGLITAAVIASNAQKDAADKASDAQEEAAESGADSLIEASRIGAEAQLQGLRESLEFQQGLFDLSREDLAPFRETGNQALLDLAGISSPGGDLFESFGEDFSFDAEDFEADPGRQFMLDEGLKALNRQAAAQGSLVSGAQLRDVTEFAEGVANQGFTQARGRALQEFLLTREGKTAQGNLLARLAGFGSGASGLGVNAATGLAASGGDLLNQAAGVQGQSVRDQGSFAANRFFNLGNIQSTGAIAQGNINANLISNLAQIPVDFLNRPRDPAPTTNTGSFPTSGGSFGSGVPLT